MQGELSLSSTVCLKTAPTKGTMVIAPYPQHCPRVASLDAGCLWRKQPRG